MSANQEDKLFKKLFRSGGSLDINEAFNKVSTVLPGMKRRRLVVRLLEEHEGSQHLTSSGSTVDKPRGRIDHLIFGNQMDTINLMVSLWLLRMR